MAKKTNGSTKPKPMEDEPISESYISIGLGLLVVVVVGILLYNYLTQRSQQTQKPDESPEISQEATSTAKPGGVYKVAEGDTLWSISEKSYGTGYNWPDIAEANNLSNSDQLEAGMELKIPEVTPVANPEASTMAVATPEATPTVEASPANVPSALPSTGTTKQETVAPANPITGNSYTVAEGDTLWDIACRAYGDCYAWVRIAEVNKLINPNLIHPGNVMTLPR